MKREILKSTDDGHDYADLNKFQPLIIKLQFVCSGYCKLFIGINVSVESNLRVDPEFSIKFLSSRSRFLKIATIGRILPLDLSRFKMKHSTKLNEIFNSTVSAVINLHCQDSLPVSDIH